MDVFGIGANELIVILILAAIVLGFPNGWRAAREAGKLIRNIKAYLGSFSDELKNELDMLDDLKKVKDDLKKF